MSLGQIIRKKRELLKLTLDEVSRQVGYSKPYLSTIETGKVKKPPSDTLLKNLEEVLEFEPGTLLHIAHVEGIPSDVRESYENTQAENLRWRSFIKRIIDSKSGPEQINELLKSNDLNVVEHESRYASGKVIPVINKVAAGYPTDFDDLDYPVGIADDYLRCPDIDDPHAFAVRVIGDSMEPKFVEGDIVIFSPGADVNNGDDCFVRLGSPHETTFKRVFFDADDTVRLQPRNEQYSPIVIDGKRINGMYKAVIKYERL